jgi:hypothetical protein
MQVLGQSRTYQIDIRCNQDPCDFGISYHSKFEVVSTDASDVTEFVSREETTIIVDHPKEAGLYKVSYGCTLDDFWGTSLEKTFFVTVIEGSGIVVGPTQPFILDGL